MYVTQRDDWIHSGNNSHNNACNIIKEQLENIRKKEHTEINRKHFINHYKALDNFATRYTQFFLENKTRHTVDTDGAICITMDKGIKLPTNCAKDLEHILHLCIPWRKGPFNFFSKDMTDDVCCKSDGYVDAEWRSEKKWNRLNSIYDVSALCKNKSVLDVGCNNFYYTFRMLEHNTNMVLGIDPTPRYFWYYKLFSILFPHDPLFYEMCGTPFFSEVSGEVSGGVSTYFDTIFCMGILYHQKNPLKCLKSLHSCLTDGGYLVIDTMCIVSKDDVCLFPQRTYQKSRGYWFIPSASVVRHWLTRSGFTIVAYDNPIPTNTEEQRRTRWINTYSLSDFLDKNDTSKTAEGYDAPHRCIVVAQKK